MNEFFNQFLGNHSAAFYIAGLIFSLMGALIYKYHSYKKYKQEQEVYGNEITFNFKIWISENWADLFISLCVSFLAVRFIDIVLTWLNPKLDAAIGFQLPETDDQIAYFLIVGMVVQWGIHKYYRKESKVNKV